MNEKYPFLFYRNRNPLHIFYIRELSVSLCVLSEGPEPTFGIRAWGSSRSGFEDRRKPPPSVGVSVGGGQA
ncbi:hypothetical protein HanRHA438_Chr17g0833051 [Helianthus annuus]|nr:hypothetical protein HanRHA438_Chr17g0833051 [Helianthus annuus]